MGASGQGAEGEAAEGEGAEAAGAEGACAEPSGARRGRKPPLVVLAAADRAVLARWAAGASAPPELARRARIVLECAAGASNQEVACQLGTSAHLVGRWRSRFALGGLPALVREARPGAPVQVGRALAPTTPDATVDGTRISRSTAGRVARAAGLRPDAESGPIPKDAVLAGVHIFVGDQVFALVVGASASSSLPAPQPSSMRPSTSPPSTSPLAALDARVREHVAATHKRHSALRVKRFLKELASRFEGATIHLVVFGQPAGIVRRWLARRPCFVVHGTGTRHAWWSLLERWWWAEPHVRDAAVAAFLASPAYEPRAFDWRAPLR